MEQNRRRVEDLSRTARASTDGKKGSRHHILDILYHLSDTRIAFKRDVTASKKSPGRRGEAQTVRHQIQFPQRDG